MLESLLAFIWVPLLLAAVTLGVGLLAERILGLELPSVLLAPLGAAVAICLGMAVYRLGAGSVVATPLVALVAIAGFALARKELRERLRPGPAGLAALAVYGLYMAPIVLSGHWTWGGYNFVNDTSSHMIWIDMLVSTGVISPDPKLSTRALIEANAGELGYPLGAHTIAALVQPLAGAQVAAIYQPVIAFAAAMSALSMTWLAFRAGLRRWPAAIAGGLGAAAGLTYHYALHGGIKEIMVVALLATAAALGREALEQGLNLRVVVAIAICLAALLHVFGAISLAFAGTLAATMLGAALLWPVRPRLGAIGAAAAVGLVAAAILFLPSLSATVSFGESARDSFSTDTATGVTPMTLGHLLRPLPLAQTAGVWLARDYRGPVPPGSETLNTLLIAVVVLLALLGLVIDLRRRRPSAALLFVPIALAAAVLAPRLSPYADSKFLVVLSPAVVLLAAIGALWLLQAPRRAFRIAGSAAALALAGGLALTAALGYNSVRLAPHERMEAMADASEHARGGGLWLVNEWEEFARFFIDDVRANPAFESESPRSAGLLDPSQPLFGRYYDLDAEALDFVTSFPGIIKRRSPDASRPPASYRLQYANDYYEVWRRRPGVRVKGHLPLQRLHRATALPSCAEVRRLAGRAAPGDVLLAAEGVRGVRLNTATAADRPAGWPPDPNNPGLVTPLTPGEVSRELLAAPGRYRAWLRGSFGRPVTARVNGREIGAADDVNTPGQWLELGTVSLRGRDTELELERPGGWISPGNGYTGEFGPLLLEPLRPKRVVRVRPSEAAARVCGRQWDWVELVDENA